MNGPASVDGPWRLVRDLDGETIPLDNSVRSTSREIDRLQAEEYRRTGIQWTVERTD